MKLRRRFPRFNLSGKLVALFLLFTLLAMVLVGASMRHTFRTNFDKNVRPHIVQYLEYVQQDLGFPPSRERARELAGRLNIEIHIIDASGQWSSNGRDVDMDTAEIEHRHWANGREYLRVESEGRDYLMVRYQGTSLLFGVPHVRQEIEGFRGLAPLMILLLLLVALYYATRSLFAPIQTIRSGVQRFGAGELDHRIDVRRQDELGDLAASVNAMAGDIRQMLDAKRQLLLAISHELRTPLTRARVATELMEDEGLRAQLNQDLQEMDALIEEIMETERMSMRHGVLNRQPCDMKRLVSETLESYFSDVAIGVSLPEASLMLEVDAPRIRMLLKNLIDNALRHSPEGAPVPRVSLVEREQEIMLQVHDNGIGIEAEHLPYLAEAFYRVDPSRQRETGGYGLGLYLCRMIAEAHGGRLMIDSTPGQGSTVTVSLPKGTD
jgi:signal transduction histidine kinase